MIVLPDFSSHHLVSAFFAIVRVDIYRYHNLHACYYLGLGILQPWCFIRQHTVDGKDYNGKYLKFIEKYNGLNTVSFPALKKIVDSVWIANLSTEWSMYGGDSSATWEDLDIWWTALLVCIWMEPDYVQMFSSVVHARGASWVCCTMIAARWSTILNDRQMNAISVLRLS